MISWHRWLGGIGKAYSMRDCMRIRGVLGMEGKGLQWLCYLVSFQGSSPGQEISLLGFLSEYCIIMEFIWLYYRYGYEYYESSKDVLSLSTI